MRSLSFIIFVYNSLLLPVRLPRVLSCETVQASKTTLFSRQMSSSTSSPATTTVERDGTYESGSASVAFVTTPDEATAKKIAEDIVEKELAACVNIIPSITSIYKWEGKINEDSEVLLMIKTRTSRIDDLAKYVRDHHPYSVAEVISLPIENGNIPYLDWISRTVRSS